MDFTLYTLVGMTFFNVALEIALRVWWACVQSRVERLLDSLR